MVMRFLILIVLGLFFSLLMLSAQEESKDVRKGNSLYNQDKYVDSEVFYRKGLSKNNNSFEATFNLGNALFKQQKYPEAIEQFTKASSMVKDKDKVASAYHNIGNALFESKEYAKSIEAYKNALKKNPTDDETRYNLALAQKYLQQQKQQQKQQQQQQQQNKEENKNQPDPPKDEEQQMSEENAKQLLDAFLQDEKDLQNKVKKNQQQVKKRPVEKDW